MAPCPVSVPLLTSDYSGSDLATDRERDKLFLRRPVLMSLVGNTLVLTILRFGRII